MCCGKKDKGDGICACDVKYKGGKLTCNGEVITNCMDLEEVVQTMMKMFCKPVVLYTVEKSAGGASGTPGILTSTSYTVPSTDKGGEYEIDYTYDAGFSLSGAVHELTIEVQSYKTPVGGVAAAVDGDTKRIHNYKDTGSVDTDNLKTTGRYFISKVELSPGETIDIRGLKSTQASITQAVCKITKIKHNS